jgi:hypothetical protein
MIDWKTLGGKTNVVDGENAFLSAWGYDSWDEALDDYGATGTTTLDKYINWLQSQTGLTHKKTIDLQNYAVANGLFTFAPTVALYDGSRGVTVTGSGVSSFVDQKSSYDNVQGTDSKRPTISDGILTFDNSAEQELAGATGRDDLAFGTANFSGAVLFKTAVDYTTDGTGMIFSTGAILGSLKGFALYFSSLDNKLKFRIRYGASSSLIDIVSNDTLNDNAWHVAYFQRDSGTCKMWVDGVEQTDNSSTVADMGVTATSNFIIGNEDGSFDGWFGGQLRQLQISSDVLTAGEIANLSTQLLKKVS